MRHPLFLNKHTAISAVIAVIFFMTGCDQNAMVEPNRSDSGNSALSQKVQDGEGPSPSLLSSNPDILTRSNSTGMPMSKKGSSNATTTVYSTLDGSEAFPASFGYQANQLWETGDYVIASQPGVLSQVHVGMSSWACESGGWSTEDCVTTEGATFSHPITINLYSVDYSGTAPSPGPPITSKTATFELPYRPSADPVQCSAEQGKFYDDRFGGCVNGYNTTITFDFADDDVVIPTEFMYGIEYNTQSAGPQPLGVTGPYNSLNFALVDKSSTGVLVGEDAQDDDFLFKGNSFPRDIYFYSPGTFPYTGAVQFDVSLEGSVTGGGWYTSGPGAYNGESGVIRVDANPDDNWFFNADPPYMTPAYFSSEEASIGNGSIHVAPIDNSSTNAAKFILRYVPAREILVSDVDGFSIDFLIDDAGTSFDANQFYVNVYTLTPDPADGASWFDCRFDFVASSGSTAQWTTLAFSSTSAATAVDDRIGGDCPTSLADMPTGSTVMFVSVNLGDTSGNDEGVGGFFDNAILTQSGTPKVWDFETPLTGRASFGFVSRYKKGANTPSGNTQFTFKAGDLNFHSSSYEWLVVNQGGSNAQFKGEGTINQMPAPTGNDYGFMIWAGDDDPDTFRIKIYYEDSGTESVVYDNGFDQPVEGGQIVIHDGK